MPTLRIVLHAHSTWSYDGKWPLASIARLFGRLGTSAVLMTEHDTGFRSDEFARYREECAKASTAACTLIPGIEYSSPDNDVHILTWGLSRFLQESMPVERILDAVKAENGIAVFAHPRRRQAWRQFQDEWTPQLDAIEVWNRKTDGLAPNGQALEIHRRTGLPGVVGIDFHTARQLYPLENRLTVAGTASLEQQILESIRNRRLTPCAFRRPLIHDEERIEDRDIPPIHHALEFGRQRLVSVRNALGLGPARG